MTHMPRNFVTRIAAAAIGCAFLIPASAMAAEEIVSSDGQIVATERAAAGATFSPSHEGTGFRNAGTVDSPAEARAYANARGIELGGRSVIGPDSRIRVTTTTVPPYRKIAQIYFKTSLAASGYAICTGWFVNANTIVTAGHCVHPGTGGSTKFYPVSTYRIYPAKNSTSNPFGVCTAKSNWTNTGWTNGGGPNVDYGAIKLNCTIGNSTGWFGYFWTSASLVGQPATVTGYPGDKPLGTMWRMSGSIGRNTASQLSYAMDTAGGQSGSPVYQNKVGCGWCSMAIHTYAASGNPPMNSGTRINQTVFNFINTIKAKP